MGWTKDKDQNNLIKTLGRNAMMEGKKMNAGDPRGSIYFTYDKLPKDIIHQLVVGLLLLVS